MFTRVLATGLMAGLLAGLFVSGLQHATTVPLILKAETYEKSGAKPAHQHGQLLAAGGAASSWRTSKRRQRPPHMNPCGNPPMASSARPTRRSPPLATAVGFSLILLAAMLASGVPGRPARSAALWGLGGFMATGLAPAARPRRRNFPAAPLRS